MKGVITETVAHQVSEGGPVVGKLTHCSIIAMSDRHFMCSHPSRLVSFKVTSLHRIELDCTFKITNTLRNQPRMQNTLPSWRLSI